MHDALDHLGITVNDQTFLFIAYHVPHISQQDRQNILVDFGKYLKHLDELQPLKFSVLENFDEKMQLLN